MPEGAVGRRRRSADGGRGAFRALAAAALAAAVTVWHTGAEAAEISFGTFWSTVTNQPCQVYNRGVGGKFEPYTWSGACVDGKVSGPGQLTFGGGRHLFDGTMKAGKQHGHGTLIWANGNRYEGEWRNGRPHGHGVSAAASGDRYEGEYRNGKQHGRGTLT